jgi:hypothetical protein
MWLLFNDRMLNLDHVIAVEFNDRETTITLRLVGGASPLRTKYDSANYVKMKVMLQEHIKKEHQYKEM